jgi:hypothetical protein
MDLTPFLDASRATEAFRRDVLAYCAGDAVERIESRRYTPPVKMMRLMAQLLHAEPELAIERISVDAWSGCSDFTGTIRVECQGETRRFEFTWCCRWRAEQEGWTDCFGFPDQIRAAREFGWQCFGRWAALDDEAAAVA